MGHDRRLISVLIAVLLAPIAVIGAILGALQSPRVQFWLAERIAAATPVRLEGFRIDWPLNLWADQLALVDEQGPWMSVSHLRFDWSPAALWGGRLHVRRLTAERLELRRRPVGEAAGGTAPRLPSLPIDLRLDELSVDSIVIDAPVYGVASEGRVSAVGRLAGGRLSLAMVLAGDAAGARGAARLAVDGTGAALSVVGQGDVHELPGALPVHAASWVLAGSADLDRGTLNIGHLRLDTDRGWGSGFGWLGGWGRDMHLHLSATLPDLAALSPNLRGRGRVDGDLVGSVNGARITASLRPQDLSTGVEDADRLLGPAPQVALGAALGTGLRPGLFMLTVAGPGGRARLGGLAREPLFIGGRLRVDDGRGMTGGRYEGWAQAEGMVVGSPTDPVLAARAEAAGSWQQKPVKATVLAAVRHVTDQPLGQATLDFSALGIDAQGNAAFQWGAVVRLDRMTVTSGGDRLAGQMAWNRAEGGLDGRLQGEVGALDRWGALAGIPGLNGAASFDLSLMRRSTQEARLTVDGRRLSFAGVTSDILALQANLRDLFGTAHGDGTVSLSGVGSGKLLADRVQLVTAGDARRLTLRLSAAGRQPAAFNLNAAGSASPSQGRYEVAMLDGTLGPEHFRLLDTARLLLQPGRTRLSPTRFALGGGSLEAAGVLEGGRLEGDLTLSALPVSLLSPLLPDLRPTGVVQGRISVGGTEAAPTLQARINGRQLNFGKHHGGVDAEMEARWDGQRLRGRLTAAGLNGARLLASGELPLRYAGGRLTLPDQPVDARIEGQGDLARLAELLPLGDQTVAGDLGLNATVGGTVDRPDINAHLRVGRGVYQNFDSGLVLSGVTLTAEGRDSRHLTLHAEGGDGVKGHFFADGTADLTQGPSFQAEARLDNMRIINLDLARISGSGQLHFAGAGAEATLSGRLDATGGQVDIAQALPTPIVTLDVVEINHPGAPPAPSPKEETEEAPFQLNLAIDTGLQGIIVRGRGLDSEWKGHLAIGGSVSRTTLSGRLSVVRGTFDLFGQQLKLTEGSVVFDGDHPPDPRVDIIAQGQSSGMTAQIRVTGTAERPDFAFDSDPPMPKDEILSHLLFGSDAGQLSVMQQITLARAAAGQIGGSEVGEFDPLSKLRKVLGLDVLQAGGNTSNDFTPPGLPAVPAAGLPGTTSVPVAGQQASASRGIGPSLSAGKYLNSRTFVRVDQGTTGGRVSVEVDLGGGFAVDTRLGEDAGGGVGLSWKKDY